MKQKYRAATDTAPRSVTIDDPERLAELIRHLDQIDGHVTLFKFSTGWKLCFGTPWLEQEPGADHDALSMLEHAPTLIELLERFIRRPRYFPTLPISVSDRDSIMREKARAAFRLKRKVER